MKNFSKIMVAIFIFLPFILCLDGCAPQGGRSGGGVVPIIIVSIIILLLPLILGIIAASKAPRFKLLVFVVVFYETLGWIFIVTIIGSPIGIGLILTSQLARLFINLEKDVNEIKNILNSNKGVNVSN